MLTLRQWWRISLIAGLITMASCTEQIRARAYGGTSKLSLPAGKKLLLLTWKDADLWYLTRDRKPGETAETYEFKESSTFGQMQGTVVIQEQ